MIEKERKNTYFESSIQNFFKFERLKLDKNPEKGYEGESGGL